jgi:hypothetical protein
LPSINPASVARGTMKGKREEKYSAGNPLEFSLQAVPGRKQAEA